METQLNLAAESLANQPELIKTFSSTINGVSCLLCDARELHAFLQVGKRFASWIQERIQKYGFEENQDFILIFQNGKIKQQDGILVSQNWEIKQRGGDRRSKDYHLTLDMAKELSMVENNAKGREARRYFIEMEKRALAATNQLDATSSTTTLIPSEQRTIQELVQYKTNDIDPTSRRKAIAEIYSRLGQKFRVAKYSQIPRTQFAEAITYIMEMTLKASAHKKTPPQNTLGEAGSYLIEQYSLALKQLLKHQDTTITTTIADHIQQKYGQPIRQIPTTEANLIFASLETLLTNAMRAWLLCSNIERWVIAEWEGHKTDMPQPIRQTLQTNNHYDPNALSISRNINQQAIQMITTQPQLN